MCKERARSLLQSGISTLAKRNRRPSRKRWNEKETNNKKGRRDDVVHDNMRRAKTIMRVAVRDLCYEHLRERALASDRASPQRAIVRMRCGAVNIISRPRGAALKRPMLSAIALAWGLYYRPILAAGAATASFSSFIGPLSPSTNGITCPPRSIAEP